MLVCPEGQEETQIIAEEKMGKWPFRSLEQMSNQFLGFYSFDSGMLDRGNFGGDYGGMGGRDFSASRDSYNDEQRGYNSGGGSGGTGGGSSGMRNQMGNRMGGSTGAYNKTFASDSMVTHY